MAISAYVGLHGSGKSYSVFEHVIVPALKQGRRVWTNIPFDHEALLKYCGAVPTVFSIEDIKRNPLWFSQVFAPGALLVIDECQKLWPSGLKACNINPDHCTFFDEHRHLVGEDGISTEIVLVTQDLGKLATRIRDDIHYTYRTVKLGVLGLDKRFRVDVYEGPVKGPKPPTKLIVRQLFGSYRKEIYSLYKSHTKSATGEAGNEQRIDGRANVFKSWKFRFAAAAVLLAPVMLWLLASSWAGIFGEEQKPVATGLPSGPAPSPEPARSLPARGLLAGKEVIIAMNNGLRGSYSFVFSLVDGTSRAEVTDTTLRKLGYRLEVVSQCAVRIIGPGYDAWAWCKAGEESKPYMPVENFAAPVGPA